jgi:hypothetical protein
MAHIPEMASSAFIIDRRAQAWAYMVISLAVLVGYGAVWTRGIQGDDLCMCELAATNDYWDAVRKWLDNWNGRLFLALTQIGTYHLPWFHDPLRAPWYLIHGMAVVGHFSACVLLFKFLVRAGITTGAALTATLVFAIHPITFEPVLWLAESYGYVFGNLLTLLTVWAYLEYEWRTNISWLALTFLMALLATLGIEQYLFVLGALAVVYLFRSHWYRPAHPPWLPLLIVACCALVFLALHFGLFSGTTERLAKATNEIHHVSGPGIAWSMAWWLSILPDASPYGGFLQVGMRTLTEPGWLVALVALAALGAAWRIAAASSWLDVAASPHPNRHLWLIITGVAVFSAALLPFFFTGKYGFALRNMYVALPGLLIVGAAVLDLLSKLNIWRTVLRFTLAPVVATFLAMSLTIDIGAQATFAQSWKLHQEVIHAIKADAKAIRQSKAVEVTGIPPVPYEGTSQLNTGWAFPCLARWVVGDEVKGWNNLMRFDQRPSGLQNSHRIHLRPPG